MPSNLARLFVLGVSLLSCGVARSDPSAFAPLHCLLGEWSGKVTVVTEDHRGKSTTTYQKESHCVFNEDKSAILMTDTEVNPWTKENTTTVATITPHSKPNTFKSIVKESDESRREFVIRVVKDGLVFEVADLPEGDKFRSTVTPMDDGTLRERGRRSVQSRPSYTQSWTTTYQRRDRARD